MPLVGDAWVRVRQEHRLADLEIGHIFRAWSGVWPGKGAKVTVLQVKSPETLPASGGTLPDTLLYGMLFAVAAAAFCLHQSVAMGSGPASNGLAIIGSATCGWSWLVVRSLFRRPSARREMRPLLLVLSLVAADAFLRFDRSDTGSLARMIDNAQALVSSSFLLFATIEPLRSLDADTPRAERLFRLIFVAGYATVLAVAVLWVDGSAGDTMAARWSGSIKASCAAIALIGIGLAIRHRIRNPLSSAQKEKKRAITDEEGAIGERLLGLMHDGNLYRSSELRIADLARCLSEAEYKVSRAITGPLGFRNFNHLANHFRIADAKRRLSDPALDHLPILTIALDCGFGSIGPFNRAFKADTGMIPTDFRRLRPL